MGNEPGIGHSHSGLIRNPKSEIKRKLFIISQVWGLFSRSFANMLSLKQIFLCTVIEHLQRAAH